MVPRTQINMYLKCDLAVVLGDITISGNLNKIYSEMILIILSYTFHILVPLSSVAFF